MKESPFSFSERVDGKPTTPFSASKEVERRGLSLLHVRKMMNHPFFEREEDYFTSTPPSPLSTKESPFSISDRVEGRPTSPFSASKEFEKRGLSLLQVRKMRNHPFSEREEGGTS